LNENEIPILKRILKMKIMLVFPPTTVYGDDPSVPPVVQPLGLAYLGAYLEREGHEVKILDGRGAREDWYL